MRTRRHAVRERGIPRVLTALRARWKRLALVTLTMAYVAASVAFLGQSQAAFYATDSGSANSFHAVDLNDYTPSGASAARLDASTCRVTWSAIAGAPAWVTYDVTDGSSTQVSAAAGTSADVATSTDITPRVFARGGSWLSTSSRTSASSCDGAPGAPTAVTLTPGDGQIAVGWTAASANTGTAITGYRATATGGATCSTSGATACTITGLTDGLSYSVTVRAEKVWGYGPASAPVSAIPYPAAIMNSSRLALWLDGADPASFFQDAAGTIAASAGDPVGLWKDKSGNNNDATQTIAASRPPLTVGSLTQGRAVPDLDGVDDYLTFDPAKMPNGTAASTSFVAMYRDQALLAYPTMLWWGTDNYGTGRSHYMDNGYLCLDTGSNAARSCTVSYTVMPLNTPRIQAGMFASGASTMWLDGDTGITMAGTLNTGATVAYFGYGGWNQSFWAGYLTETVIFNGTLTNSERRTVEEYLGRKWVTAITASAPTGTAAAVADPTSVTVSWAAPPWDGGSAVTGYTATASPGGQSCTTTGLSCVVTGLTTSTPYTFAVTAANSEGTGPASATAGATPQ